MKPLLLVVTLLVAIGIAWGQGLDLETYVERVLASSSEAQRVQDTLDQARVAAESHAPMFVTSIQGSTDLTYLGIPPSDSSGGQRLGGSDWYIHHSVRLDVPIFPQLSLGTSWSLADPSGPVVSMTLKPFARDLIADKDQLEYEVAQLEAFHNRVKLELEARVRYLAVLRFDKLYSLAKKTLENAETAQRVTELRAQQELADARDVTKRRFAVLDGRLASLRAEKSQQDARKAFSQLANLSPATEDPTPPEGLPPQPPESSLVLDQVLSRDMELAALRLRETRAQRDVENSQWAWPSLSLSAGSTITAPVPAQTIALGLSLSPAAFNQAEAAKLALRQAQRATAERRQAIADTVDQAIADLQLQHATLAIRDERRKEAERDFAGAELRFHQDEILSINLDEASLVRYQAETEYEAGRMDLWTAWFRLVALIAG